MAAANPQSRRAQRWKLQVLCDKPMQKHSHALGDKELRRQELDSVSSYGQGYAARVQIEPHSASKTVTERIPSLVLSYGFAIKTRVPRETTEA
jgi:hypothetical protein